MHSCLFVWENCILVISVTRELQDASWQTSSAALRCPPKIYIFITMRGTKQSDITAHAANERPALKDLIECIQMWFIEQLHSYSVSHCFAYSRLSSFSYPPHPLANTPFKLEIGLAFVGDTEGESIGALITAIHYPNKHGTQPLPDTNSGVVSVWLETKAWTGNPCCINLQDQTPLSARAPPGSVQPGINPHAQAVSYGHRIQTQSCDMAPTPLCCCSASLSLFGT